MFFMFFHKFLLFFIEILITYLKIFKKVKIHVFEGFKKAYKCLKNE